MKKYIKIALLVVLAFIFIGTCLFIYQIRKPDKKSRKEKLSLKLK